MLSAPRHLRRTGERAAPDNRLRGMRGLASFRADQSVLRRPRTHDLVSLGRWASIAAAAGKCLSRGCRVFHPGSSQAAKRRTCGRAAGPHWPPADLIPRPTCPPLLPRPASAAHADMPRGLGGPGVFNRRILGSARTSSRTPPVPPALTPQWRGRKHQQRQHAEFGVTEIG